MVSEFFKKLIRKSEFKEQANTFRTLDVPYPKGLRIKILDKSVLTNAGHKAMCGDELNVEEAKKYGAEEIELQNVKCKLSI